MTVGRSRTVALIAIAVVCAGIAVTAAWIGSGLVAEADHWFATVPYQDPSDPTPPSQAVFDYYSALETSGSALIEAAGPFVIAAIAAPLALLGLLARRHDLLRSETASA